MDVSKAAYILRCNGDRVSEAALHSFDDGVRAGVEETLAGGISDESWVQATLGVDAAGLGFREAAAVALPAFVSSRVASRPLVADMASHLEQAGICRVDVFMAVYDARTNEARGKLRESLPAHARAEADRLITDSAAAAAKRWDAWVRGVEPDPEDPPEGSRPRGSRRPGAGVLPGVGEEDPEHPAAPQGAGGMRLQRMLTRLTDAHAARGLVQRATAAGDWDRVQLLTELTSPGVSHEWLWGVDANKGPALEPEDFVPAVRLRLGSAGPSEEVLCAACGQCYLGPSCSHALLCAKGPSTRGHNAVRDTLHNIASSLDPTTELEPRGLISSRPGLRPADLLTGVSGLSGRLVALDVGICSPAAAGAGDDCVESMRQRKVEFYQPFERELEAAGVEYRPVTFSCFGRPHEDSRLLVQSLARRLARRHGTEAHVEERRIEARIAVDIWRRAARMVRRCLPTSADEAAAAAEEHALDAAAVAQAGDPGSVGLPPAAPAPAAAPSG